MLRLISVPQVTSEFFQKYCFEFSDDEENRLECATRSGFYSDDLCKTRTILPPKIVRRSKFSIRFSKKRQIKWNLSAISSQFIEFSQASLLLREIVTKRKMYFLRLAKFDKISQASADNWGTHALKP